jgi:hypothetical protein
MAHADIKVALIIALSPLLIVALIMAFTFEELGANIYSRRFNAQATQEILKSLCAGTRNWKNAVP